MTSIPIAKTKADLVGYKVVFHPTSPKYDLIIRSAERTLRGADVKVFTDAKGWVSFWRHSSEMMTAEQYARKLRKDKRAAERLAEVKPGRTNGKNDQ